MKAFGTDPNFTNEGRIPILDCTEKQWDLPERWNVASEYTAFHTLIQSILAPSSFATDILGMKQGHMGVSENGYKDCTVILGQIMWII